MLHNGLGKGVLKASANKGQLKKGGSFYMKDLHLLFFFRENEKLNLLSLCVSTCDLRRWTRDQG